MTVPVSYGMVHFCSSDPRVSVLRPWRGNRRGPDRVVDSRISHPMTDACCDRISVRRLKQKQRGDAG